MDELDRIFGGEASKHYVKHVVQSWSKEPFIRGFYTFDTNSATQAILRLPLDGKVFFAGETYADSWATVHGAALSGFEAVDQILASPSRALHALPSQLRDRFRRRSATGLRHPRLSRATRES